MAGSDEATEWRRASKFYRRPPGLVWLIGLFVIPLLLGVIGYGERGGTQPEFTGPTGALPTLRAPGGAPGTPTIPAVQLAPVSIIRSGDDIKLSGDFPSREAMASLVEAVRASFGPNVNIIDNLHINPDVTGLDFSNAAAVFKAGASIPDFGLAVNGDTITLSGTAGSLAQQQAVEQAAATTWPHLNIVDTVGISGPAPLSAPPAATSPPPAPASVPPAASSAPPSPVPAPGAAPAGCGNLGADIKALGPITFPTNGFTLTPADDQTLNQVADKLKACPGAKVAINGYTDNTGTDAINGPLSSNRANAVADYLTAHGVAKDQLTAKGFGSADPVADNGNPDGQAKNRRVEIVVS
jgi:peptidoglycan-binding protein ArfA